MLLRLTLLATAVLLLVAAPAQAARPLQLGFLDDVLGQEPATSAPWLERAVDTNADVVRVSSGWGSVATAKPSSPTDPADPAYNWSGLDQSVKDAAGAGLKPFVSLVGAPAWAQGSGKPSSVTTLAWKPDAAAYAQFAQALARRYDGTYPDPAAMGASLPKVTAFQAWNEQNLTLYLAPQWTKRSGRYTNSGAQIYRDLLNGFYAGIKKGQPGATVVSGGTAPFGDPKPGGQRTMPALFTRNMLCLNAKLKRTCSSKVHFDAIAHHPYSVGGPTRKALNTNDVSIPDLAKLTKPVAAAVRAGTALPRRSKALWITELSYDTKPPDPNGVLTKTQARWLQQAFALLYLQGASVITWFQIRDQAPVPSYGATNQSGVYFRDGRAKPSQQSFAFPVVVTSRTRTRLKVFLRAPAAGDVVVERRVGGRWRRAATVHAGRHAVRLVSVPRSGTTAVRARVGGARSLTWTV